MFIVFLRAVFAVTVFGLVSNLSLAQTDNVKNDPNATRTIKGLQLPPPPPEYRGVIRDNLGRLQKLGDDDNFRISKSWWEPRIVPPEDAPNVLLIMTDDVGFGAPSTFGGVIPTPTLEKVAERGLRYTRFHSTALCSPTRAALITGRNHHSVSSAVVAELANGFPGYNTVIPRNAATIGTILQQHGYATSWIGKNHNVPIMQKSQAGPFDRWPAGLGFDYFYGFPNGDTSQWQPNLYRNTTRIYPNRGIPNWNLTTAMADEAIAWLNQLNSVSPDKPFFCYYVPGGTHAPHHPTKEWIAKIEEMHLFDKGWMKLRQEIFARQRKIGVIPQDAALTKWPTPDEYGPLNSLPEWDTLTDKAKKLFIKQVEVYAAYLAYTDHEIGRVIQAVEDMGKLDNTLVIYISGDNGASAEGTKVGTPNEVTYFNQVLRYPVDEQMAFYHEWGSDETYPHMAASWAWALDTPYLWTKQIASHFGGTRQGMCISWPKRIKPNVQGDMRHQFHHVIDIVPTILEATGIQAPKVVDGIPQKDIEGVSMAYTFDKDGANSPSTHKTQYFEMMGPHGIYHDGWYACTTPLPAPWNVLTPPPRDPAHGYDWELYNINRDWTQAHDLLKAKDPKKLKEYRVKLKEMQTLFWEEAEKYQVAPLDADKVDRLYYPRPTITSGRTNFVYVPTEPSYELPGRRIVPPSLTGIPLPAAPKLINTSYSITAVVQIDAKRPDGLIVTAGGRFSGWALYLKDRKPVFTYNINNRTWNRWEGTEPLVPREEAYVISLEFQQQGGGPPGKVGKGGTGTLRVGPKIVDRHDVEETIKTTLQWDESFDIGFDTGTGVYDKDYTAPYPFSGGIRKVSIKLLGNE